MRGVGDLFIFPLNSVQHSALKQRPLHAIAGRWCWIMLLIVSPGEMLLPNATVRLHSDWTLYFDAEHTVIAASITGSTFVCLIPCILLLNNTLTDTDRWLTLLFCCILCCVYNLAEMWAEPIDPSCYTAGEHRCGSCPSNWIAPALTAPAPAVREFRWGVDKRSWSAGRTGSVCAVCTLLINPQRDSVQIIPHSPTKTQELNSIEFVRKGN